MPSDYSRIFRGLIQQHCIARNIVLKGEELRGIELSGLRADGLHLEEADLRESVLTEVKWKGCILRDARLDEADFTDAVLRLCDLDQARAIDTKFVRTHLENSTARGSCFDRADFTEAVLTDTDFSRASFRNANLTGVSVSGASFRGADLHGATLRNADLTDADLRGADLTEANLEGAILEGADLRGAIDTDRLVGEPVLETLPEELKPLIGTVTPLVDEMLRSAGQNGLLDSEATEQLKVQMAAIQGTYPSRSVHPDTLEALSEVIGSLSDDAFPALLVALSQPGNGDPPPAVQDLIWRLGQALALGDNASPDEVLAKLASPEPSENDSPKQHPY
jgi:uncharacterized protein YjbI with pentapeptide repeats